MDCPPVERILDVEGVEVDFSSHEIGGVLSGILKGNGNFIERIIGHILLVKSPALAELRPLVQASLSRRVHRHYRGFAVNQQLAAEKTRRAKQVLYVLRTTLTGTHLLLERSLVTDLRQLAPLYGFVIDDLLLAKNQAEKQPLSEQIFAHAQGEMRRAFGLLDHAHAHANLPDDPPNAAEIEEWLVAARLSRV